jgi:uncharacterized protein YgiM (DUF1202 family)
MMQRIATRVATISASGVLALSSAAGIAAADCHGMHGPYRGRVISPIGLNVRTGPSTHHRIIGTLRAGQVVSITCKVNGQWIAGNPRWYKLSNHRSAWSAARYIANIGPAPRFC